MPQGMFVQGHLCLRTEKSLVSLQSGHGLSMDVKIKKGEMKSLFLLNSDHDLSSFL